MLIRLLVILVLAVLSGCMHQPQPTDQVIFHNTATQPLEVYMATHSQQWQAGLGDVPRLQSHQGMYFGFTDLAPRTFWMQGVSYPIDIIWIQRNKVIGTTTHVQPEELGVPIANYRLYPSPGPIDAAIEVAAGYVEAYGLNEGITLDVIH